ncbi:MAG: glycosyltransferase family 39 protein [Saprospiraceae bacterium]
MGYFTVVHRIGSLPLQPWDESLFALRALFISDTGEYMSDFSQILIEQNHRNTKLPFTTLLQVLTFKLLGTSILSLRLPNILIFIVSCYYVSKVFKKHLQEKWIGVLYTLILISSSVWIRPHIMRTGDQDAAFSIYLTVGIIAFYIYDQEYKSKWALPLFSIMIIFGALTKNLLAFIPGTAIFIYLIYRKTLFTRLKSTNIWLAILAIFGSYIGVILYLNQRYAGFIDRMWNYELGGRFTKEIENTGPWWKYIDQLTTLGNMPFILFAGYILVLAFTSKIEQKLKDLVVLLSLYIASYLTVISISKTKCDWYDAPLIPAIALMAAIGIIEIYKRYINTQKGVTKSILTIILSLTILIPYMFLAIDISNSKSTSIDARHGPFMERVVEKNQLINTFTVAVDKWAFTQMWYIKKLNKLGYHITYSEDNSYSINEYVVLCSNKAMENIDKKYTSDIIYHEKGKCKLLKIVGSKR